MKKQTLKPGLLVQNIDEELIVLDPDSDAYFGLNEVGHYIFNALQEKMPTQEIVNGLTETFAVEKELAEKDVEYFVGELLKSGLLVIT